MNVIYLNGENINYTSVISRIKEGVNLHLLYYSG